MRLNSRADTEGSPVSSLNCDRSSHLNWVCLGVLRAAGVDKRMLAPTEKLAGLARLYKYTVQAPGLEGKRTGPGLG